MPRAKKAAPTPGAITAGRLSRPLSASDAAVWDAFEHDGGALPAQFMQRLYAPDSPRKRQESEASFMAAIIELATLLNWKVYHTHDSRRSEAGYPDLTLVRDGRKDASRARLLFVELKSERGRVRREQKEWMSILELVPNVEVYVWRPSMWQAIEKILRA